MTKQKTTKRALLMSALSLLLCASMLAGSTFAWFTDEVKSGTNIIAAGNLDVELTHADKGTNGEFKPVDERVELFDDVDLWEPGAVAYEKLTVANVGDLSLKYQLAINVANANGVEMDGKYYTLADVLQVAVVAEEDIDKIDDSREAAIAAGEKADWQTLASFTKNGELLPQEGENADTYGIVIYWEPSDNDNIFNLNNGKTTTDGGKQLTIDLGVHLAATQLTSESDSFDKQYDVDAEYPTQVIKVSSVADLAAALASGEEMPIALASNIDDFDGTVATASIMDLGGYSLRSNGITVKNDLDMSNGEVSMRTTSGYLDIRPTESDTYAFTNVDFVNQYKRKANNNTGSDRIEYMVKLYPMAEGVKSTFVFENCTFENASVYFGASSDKPADIDVTFKNCTFNAMMGSDPVIEFSSTTTGTVNIDGCTFNIEGTYSNSAVIGIKTWSSVTLNVTATNNTLNANKAIPYTYDPAKGETEVDSVKLGTSNVRNYRLFDCLTGKYSTIVETGTTLIGDIAVGSK